MFQFYINLDPEYSTLCFIETVDDFFVLSVVFDMPKFKLIAFQLCFSPYLFYNVADFIHLVYVCLYITHFPPYSLDGTIF